MNTFEVYLLFDLNITGFIFSRHNYRVSNEEKLFLECEHPAQSFIRRAQNCFGESCSSLKSQKYFSSYSFISCLQECLDVTTGSGDTMRCSQGSQSQLSTLFSAKTEISLKERSSSFFLHFRKKYKLSFFL